MKWNVGFYHSITIKEKEARTAIKNNRLSTKALNKKVLRLAKNVIKSMMLFLKDFTVNASKKLREGKP